MTNVLLVTGNGFDLTAGLKSKYDDFFVCRMKDIFGENVDIFDKLFFRVTIPPQKDLIISETKGSLTNLEAEIDLSLYHKDIFKYNKTKNLNWKKYKELNRWDVFFLFAEKYLDNSEFQQWQDIENIIFNVITIALKIERKKYNFKYDRIPNDINLTFKGENTDEQNEMESKFLFWIQTFSMTDSGDLGSIATTLLDDLNKFEEDFGQYILGQMKRNEEYFDNAKKLLSKLLINTKESSPIVDVLSFNYSLGQDHKNKIKPDNVSFSTWNNVHGLAYNAEDNISPIFGIDNHEIIDDGSNDLRIMFTKSYRTLNSENDMVSVKPDFENIDEIIIYGHSLSKADYTYFISIFDECDIYNSDVKLTFYFYPKGESTQTKEDNNEDSAKVSEKVVAQRKRREYTKAVTNLINSYGMTSNQAHGENILTKLQLEHRISIREDPEIN